MTGAHSGWWELSWWQTETTGELGYIKHGISQIPAMSIGFSFPFDVPY